MNQLVMERTAPRPVSAARRGRGAPVPTQAQPREIRSVLAVAAGVLAILVLASWSFAQGWGRGLVPGAGELAVGGGIVRVDGAISATRPQQGMPGMGTDEDPVAEGDRRVSVDVTLLAGTGTMEFAADRFDLWVDGEATDHLTHRDVLPGTAVPAGMQLSGTLLFDVPADTLTATLTYDRGGSIEVALPPEGEQAASDAPVTDPMTDAGHGSDGHADDEATQDAAGAGE